MVFEAPWRSNVHVWSSRAVVCEPRRPGLVGPPGFHTTVREPKRAHLRVPVFKKHHQNSTRRHPEREEKNEFCGGRGKKKSEILGGPGEGGPGKGGPGKGGPGKGGPGKGGPGKAGPGGTEHDQTKTLKPPHGNRETNTHKHTHTHTNTHTTHTNTTNTHKHTKKQVEVGLAKVGLAKVGLAKVGLAKVGFGQSRFWPKSAIPLKH